MENLLKSIQALSKEEKLAFMKEAMPHMARFLQNDPQKMMAEMMPFCMNMMKSKGNGHGQDAFHDEEHDGMRVSPMDNINPGKAARAIREHNPCVTRSERRKTMPSEIITKLLAHAGVAINGPNPWDIRVRTTDGMPDFAGKKSRARRILHGRLVGLSTIWMNCSTDCSKAASRKE